MITAPKLGVWIATAALSVVIAPQAWAAGAGPGSSAVAASSATAVVSASSSAIPAALQQALAQPEGKDRDKAVRDAAVEWQKSDPAAALGWAVAQADALPKSKLYWGTLGAVSQTWANRDPAAAVAWSFANFAKQPKPSRYEMLAFHLTLVQWSVSDPKAAMAWADATVPADSSQDIKRWVYGSIGDGWGRGGWAKVDPVATAAWAETVKDDKNRQVVVNEVAMLWSRTKPEDAAVWAKRLPPADLKIAVSPIFEALYHRDSAKATEWLDSLTLPDEMKAELKKKAEAVKPKS